MNNTPLKPVHASGSAINPLHKNQESVPSASDAKHARSGDDAATSSLPRTSSGEAPAKNPANAMESLVESIRSSADASSVHGGLEASRVFDLLNDPDE